MATTQPTPQPPNPTTDSEETPPTTNQQTQEPTDPPTTDSTSGNTNGDIQATDSEGAAGTELRVPTTSETSTATDLPILSSSGSTNIGLIIGSAAAGIAVLISILTIVIIVSVLLKKHGKINKKEGCPVKNVAAVPIATTTNEAYGLACHDYSQSGVEENTYNYPEFDEHTIEAKQNEAYATHTKFNISTEGNQAYGTNNIIMTEINSAYGQVETADEYDYIS